MKNSILIYIIYIEIILLVTILFSTAIIYKEMNIPFISNFIALTRKSYTTSIDLDSQELEKSITIPKERQLIENSAIKNSEGFKDYQHPIEKPNDTIRIIALGDSMTYGASVSMNNTWPNQLETKLNKLNSSRKFEVLNFGIPGASTLEEVKDFEEKGLKYNPDMIVLQFEGDDWRDSIWIKSRGKELLDDYSNGKFKLPENFEKIAKELGDNERGIGILIFYIATNEFENKTKQTGELDVWTENVENPLLHLMQICKDRNIKLIVMGWDFGWPFKSSEKELLENFLDENNIQFMDLSPDIPLNDAQLRLTDGHLSELGYSIVSDKIMRFIIS